MKAKTIAVVNRTNFKNYGSILQCFALLKAIEAIGYRSEVLWVKGGLSANYDIRFFKVFGALLTLIKHPKLLSRANKSVKELASESVSPRTADLFDRFVQENIKCSFFRYTSLKRICKTERYLKCVCGSDQIWNPDTLYLDPLLFLRFAPLSKRIAYAPSLGCDYIPEYNKQKMGKYVSEIPYVSVREKQARDLLKELCGEDYFVACDPTLLHEKTFWDTFAKEPANKNYVLCYFLDAPVSTIQKQISDIARKNGQRVVVLRTVLHYLDSELQAEYPDCGPCEFLGFIKNASLIVTDSYHGLLFSLIFQKNFVSIERQYKDHDQSSRQKTVLEELNLLYKYGKSIDNKMLGEIDYENVSKELELIRTRSLLFLKRALEG